MHTRSIAVAAALLLAAVPSTARPVLAQAGPPTPTPIVVPTLPPTDPTTSAIIQAAAGVLSDAIARERYYAANTTRGTVTYFHRFDLQVRTGQNTYRSVRLHPGTVINPRGATPGDGTSVAVSGHAQADGTLDADTVTVLR